MQNRPLPGAPLGILGERWISRENLLVSQPDSDDPNLFVALYEFQADGDSQMKLAKGGSCLESNYMFYILQNKLMYYLSVLSATVMESFMTTFVMVPLKIT